ncbi:hypothetical protein EDD15DRAFT_2260170, partial [Pisolithus albus]
MGMVSMEALLPLVSTLQTFPRSVLIRPRRRGSLRVPGLRRVCEVTSSGFRWHRYMESRTIALRHGRKWEFFRQYVGLSACL